MGRGVASRLARWLERGAPVQVGIPAAAGPIRGTPVLTQQFPLGTGQLNLAVEIAWGAVISQPLSTWTWTDVTHDVQYAQKIAITIGRPDESSTPQPANLGLTLLNTSGNYSYGAQSANYPNVKKNVPVRVSLIYRGVQYTRFLGYSTGFTPDWDVTGNYAIVNLTAAGVKRRLAQAVTPLQSVLRTAIPALAGLVGYWPMEDGSTATQFASGLASGGLPMTIVSGACTPASSSAILASGALPVVNTAGIAGPVTSAAVTGTAQMRFLAIFPPTASAAPDGSVIASIHCSGGTVAEWFLLYRTPGTSSGGFQLTGVDANGNQLYASPIENFEIDGTTCFNSFSAIQSGANVNVQIESYRLGTNGAFAIGFTVSNQTFGYATRASINDFGQMGNTVMGQVTLSNVYQDIFNLFNQVNGYAGEYAGSRMDRLTAQSGEYFSRWVGDSIQKMGAQTPDTFLNLMEGCAAVESGYLYDGAAQGLSFFSEYEITSQAPAMILDANLGQIAPPLSPVDDDLLIINEYTATRTNGSSATWTDTTSPLSVPNIGEYSQSTTQDFYSDGEQLTDFAAWKVNVGTVNDYRWTPVPFWLHRNPELLPTWLATTPMMRIDIINLVDVRVQLQNLTVQTLLEGYTETFDQFTWSVNANCSSYQPWRVAEVAQESGDTGEFVGRCDTDGANLTQAYAAGATSLLVATPSGPLWTTAADDFPLQVNIGGNPITVTAITGSSSPQTFTVTGSTVVAPLANGAAVSVWNPAVLDVIAF